ncbi:MAG: hypothetical protein WBO71_13210, partial [Thermoanaerobaculia bacterium]
SLANLATAGVVWVSILLGLTAIARAVSGALGLPLLPGSWLVGAASASMLLLAVPVYRFLRAQAGR